MRILFIGDIMGRPGRECLKTAIPGLDSNYRMDVIIANGENSAGGWGITQKVAREIFDAGVDVITGGNHIWDNKDVFNFIDQEERLLRPLNYPPGTPGRGSVVFEKAGRKIGVICLAGQVFMPEIECPFRKSVGEIERLKRETPIIIVDFHAEATSEKNAMGWFLNDKASAVIGTHTHVQTADEKIIGQQMGYITDVGMTGPFNSVIGVNIDQAIEKFTTKLPVRFRLGDAQPAQLNALFLEVDNEGICTYLERINMVI